MKSTADALGSNDLQFAAKFSMDHAKCGAEALAAKKYPEAIEAYPKALVVSPESPDYYIKRSTAHQRSQPGDHESALADADKAVVYAQKRAKRELIIEAQLRRAIALFGLGRHGDAKFVFDIVKRLDPNEKTLPIWMQKNDAKLNAADCSETSSTVTVEEMPRLQAVPTTNTTESDDTKLTEATETSGTTAQSTQTPADKIKHSWFQTPSHVTFTLFAKGVPKDKTTVVDIAEDSLSVSFPLVTETTYAVSFDPLYAPIDVLKSTYTIMSTKIEVVLCKAQPGQKWHSMERSSDVNDATLSTVPKTQQPSLNDQPPAYPTSSRNGAKDWDRLAADLTKKKEPRKDEGGTEIKDDDDYDYDQEGGDQTNAFFKKLYAGSSPDVQRAMMKSFTESNGTALSTNWSDVGKRKVETMPPDGMSAKQW